MKKYIQITIVLGVFFFFVYLRHMQKENSQSTVYITPHISTSPSFTPQNTPTTGASSGRYKNGIYTGSVEDAYYGNLQVQVTIAQGKIVDVIFLQYPNDNGTSRFINQQAMPQFKSEAIQAQSASVDIVSGASSSSQAFQKSLANALRQAS